MKKFFVFLLAVIMTLSTAALIVGCDENTGTGENASVTVETTSSDDSSVADVSSSAPAGSSVTDDSSDQQTDEESTGQVVSTDSSEEKEESAWAEHFDLTDEKIIFNTEVDHTTLRSYLRIFLKKAKDDYRVTVEDFENENVEAVLYGFFEPDERRLNEEGYLENFRQDIYLYLKYTPGYKMSDEELLNVIHDIEKLDFVKVVSTVQAVNG